MPLLKWKGSLGFFPYTREGPSMEDLGRGKDHFMNTGEKQFEKHVSVPSGKGVRMDKQVTINQPVSEVYSFWTNLENLARFMRNVESVTVKV